MDRLREVQDLGAVFVQKEFFTLSMLKSIAQVWSSVN
jgi:hypothetical protein